MGINNLVRADFKQRVVKLITEAPYDLDDLEDVDELLGVFDLKAMGPELVDRYCNDVEILIERVVDPSLPRGREAKVVEVLNYGVAYKASGDTYERAKVRSGGFPGS